MAYNNKKANLWVARIIPVLLFAIIGYSSWVFTKLIGVNYLAHPSPNDFVKPRRGLAAALIALYYIFLFPMLVCYLQLIQIIVTEPGFVPKGNLLQKNDIEKDRDGHKRRRRSRSSASRIRQDPAPWTGTPDSINTLKPDPKYVRSELSEQQIEAGLEDWWTKDVFVCQYDGIPAWCSTCMNFKPDRAHHCREVQRCVKKMDHFCPWVGGIISETSFKFFIQFVSYGSVFCAYTLIVLAVFVAERHKKTGNYNVHWVLTMGLAILFSLFSIGMSASSIQLALANTTTIENLSKKSSIWYLAIHISRPELLPHQTNPNSPPLFRTITFPLPNPRSNSRPSTESQSQSTTITASTPPRTFAILESRKGDNPFDLGSPLRNIQEVMGYRLIDWLIPLKRSPCADHSSSDSAFKLGRAVQRMKEEAGLEPYIREESASGSSRRRKRRRHTVGNEMEEMGSGKKRRRFRRRHGSREGGKRSPGVLA